MSRDLKMEILPENNDLHMKIPMDGFFSRLGKKRKLEILRKSQRSEHVAQGI